MFSPYAARCPGPRRLLLLLRQPATSRYMPRCFLLCETEQHLKPNLSCLIICNWRPDLFASVCIRTDSDFLFAIKKVSIGCSSLGPTHLCGRTRILCLAGTWKGGGEGEGWDPCFAACFTRRTAQRRRLCAASAYRGLSLTMASTRYASTTCYKFFGLDNKNFLSPMPLATFLPSSSHSQRLSDRARRCRWWSWRSSSGR
jgi:hypothetical protein